MSSVSSTQKRAFGLAGYLALFFISLILRPPVASMGPLLHEIIGNLGLSAVEAGILTSAPVLCFGLGAFASPALVRRFGVNRSMLLVLVTLTIATALRLAFGYPGLLVGTLAAGLSIAVANVLLPTIVRVEFPGRVPLITGAYTTLLTISASLAASVAVPSSEFLGGWRLALAVWIIPAVLAVIFWAPKSYGQEVHVAQATSLATEEKRAVLRSPISWAIVGFFGLQSLGFYAILGWLPTMLIGSGVEPAAAGAYLGLATAVGIPIGLAMSIVIGRFKSLAWWAAGASATTFLGYVFLFASLGNSGFIPVACVLISLGQSSTFPMSLSIIGTRASTRAQTTQLSAMAQGWGYLLAAAGTFGVGYLAEVSGGWGASLTILGALTAIQILIGFYSGRPGLIPAK
jgi:CP family cyanate transporter-like MFS transporter